VEGRDDRQGLGVTFPTATSVVPSTCSEPAWGNATQNLKKARVRLWTDCTPALKPRVYRQNVDFSGSMPIIQEERPDQLAAQLDANLCSFNEAVVGPRRNEKLALAIREGEQLLAGLFAEIVWNALHIDLLWVAAEYRRRGYGRSLVQRAEQLARQRACDVAYLSTFDFHAPPFYVAMGYRVIGELVGVPRGSRRLWFGKTLTEEDYRNGGPASEAS
jgi:GNAT superfamily N-acetyltransferase